MSALPSPSFDEGHACIAGRGGEVGGAGSPARGAGAGSKSYLGGSDGCSNASLIGALAPIMMWLGHLATLNVGKSRSHPPPVPDPELPECRGSGRIATGPAARATLDRSSGSMATKARPCHKTSVYSEKLGGSLDNGRVPRNALAHPLNARSEFVAIDARRSDQSEEGLGSIALNIDAVHEDERDDIGSFAGGVEPQGPGDAFAPSADILHILGPEVLVSFAADAKDNVLRKCVKRPGSLFAAADEEEVEIVQNPVSRRRPRGSWRRRRRRPRRAAGPLSPRRPTRSR
ncbi:hypothetical protein BDK51DRAFT_38875 [Blyttiomyces helicus]|uniref:Uncharacterized protein n=1 Tax=Blyttiomyces helicus TaxID=388810 RepID=A0A4P9W1Q5_9FUNG|nr:hypothetical protein BDK51DRAFT_38875 [Blyttiomyces helicus]|eukprot:RKO85093.1 hypothetical protein BDK51DRAFT_38875 [Blyttiomyces helicus]